MDKNIVVGGRFPICPDMWRCLLTCTQVGEVEEEELGVEGVVGGEDVGGVDGHQHFHHLPTLALVIHL